MVTTCTILCTWRAKRNARLFRKESKFYNKIIMGATNKDTNKRRWWSKKGKSDKKTAEQEIANDPTLVWHSPQRTAITTSNNQNSGNNLNLRPTNSSSQQRPPANNNNKESTESSTIKTIASLKKKATTSNNNKRRKSSWFCRTSFFDHLCNGAFDCIDIDRSNSVDSKELYSGLLLIHLKLGCYAGPAACRPLSRERCDRVFEQFDEDHSNSLDKQEFKQVMMVLFSNVFMRVMVQWTMTLMIVPVLAQYVLNIILWMMNCIVEFVTNLDEHSAFFNGTELLIENTYGTIVDTMGLSNVIDTMERYLDKVPDSVWNALPLGIISAILGIAVVPYCIFQIDDFFQRVAERKSAKRKRKNK